ncbi:MAG: hypothetical protein ACTSU5_03035 [Promethearchaeota archaeon]
MVLDLFKKKKVRLEFDELFKAGDEEGIKRMLNEHPWLLEEWQGRMDDSMEGQQEVIAALGIMEDELVGPVPIDEISYCLRVDLKINKEEEDIVKALNDSRDLGYCKQVGQGWTLTVEGGKVCDHFLNTHIGNLEGNVQ